MPIVAHNALPTFQRLDEEGISVLPPDRAAEQDIRELHIGLLNMMPDKALAATERQFFRLIGGSNPIAQFYIHPFTLPELSRSQRAREHVSSFYDSFDELREQGLDALIITGANVVGPDLSKQPFWEPLIEVIDWAYDNVTSTLCSCLATHAVLEFRYWQRRAPRPSKTWGVFPHRLVDKRHPLVADVNTRFDVPHSRWNDVSREQFDAAGLRVLAQSDVGVHLATSADGFRFVFSQGHPEYDTVSLLKEYKREVARYAKGERALYPPLIDHYFSEQGEAILREFQAQVESQRASGVLPAFPDDLLMRDLDNTWRDTAHAIVSNWAGLVYQLTNSDRRLPFMKGVDPEDPLGLVADRR